MTGQDGGLWGVILSGGEGTRLQHFIKRLYGIVRPKQYCPIVGDRSMLQRTHDRLRLLIPQERICTIVNRSHLSFVHSQLRDQPLSTILVQPCGRETANGILLALLHIYDRCPGAVAAVFPSDHFVGDEARFMNYVDLAHRVVQRKGERIILLGVQPTGIEQEYGWIEKDYPIKNPWNVRVHHISRFWEKPDRDTAEKLYQRKCLWNTLVMVGKVRSFLLVFKKMVPGIFDKLSKLMKFPDQDDRQKMLNSIYPSLPCVNFSKTILERNADRFSVLEAAGVYWSDWGDERRVLRDVEKLQLTLSHDSFFPGISTVRDLDPNVPGGTNPASSL